MLRLPRCPHCGMYFRYRQVSAGRMLGKKTCPHCHKGFKASIGMSIWLVALLLFSSTVLLNILMLRIINATGWIVIFISLSAALLFIILMPLTIRYLSEEKEYSLEKERVMLDIKDDTPALSEQKGMSRSVRIRLKKQQNMKR